VIRRGRLHVVCGASPPASLKGRPGGGYAHASELICCELGDLRRRVRVQAGIDDDAAQLERHRANKFAADEPKPATGGEVTLYVNDEPVGSGRMEHTVSVRAVGKALANAARNPWRRSTAPARRNSRPDWPKAQAEQAAKPTRRSRLPDSTSVTLTALTLGTPSRSCVAS
jgi:hypothetical protein